MNTSAFIHLFAFSYFLMNGSITSANNPGITHFSSGLTAQISLRGEKDLLVQEASKRTSQDLGKTLLDEQDRKMLEKTSPRTLERMDRNDPLTVNDVIKLSQGGISDSTILGYMLSTPTVYRLSQTQIRRLKNAGVSEQIIRSMRETEETED